MTEMSENYELEQLIDLYKSDPSIGNLNNLAEKIRTSVVHMPGKLNDQKRIAAVVFNMKDGKKLIPIFTNKDKIAGNVPNGTTIALIPFREVINIAAREIECVNLDGIIINIGTANIIFNRNLILKFKGIYAQSDEANREIPLDLENSIPPVKNGKIEKAMFDFSKADTDEEKKHLLDDILNMARKAYVLVPLGQNNEGKLSPLIFFSKQNNEKFLPVYLDSDFARKRHPENKFMVHTFDEANSVCINMKQEADGMMLIGEEVTVNLKMTLLENVKAVHEQQNKNEKNILNQKNIQKTDDAAHMDANISAAEKSSKVINISADEMKKFTMLTLPNLLFGRGSAFIERIEKDGASYVDELFENAYYNVRMYPYVTEEFSVLSISANDHTDVYEIEFPKRDQCCGSAARSYIVWDRSAEKARYFAICKNADDAMLIEEVTDEGIKYHGGCAIETNEMSKILDIIGI